VQRLGILGAGTVARHHADAARALGADIVAACTRRADSPNWELFLRHAPNARRVEDGESLLVDPAVDGLVACPDWRVLPQWLDRLLASPMPVLIEKPIGLDLGSVRKSLEKIESDLGSKMVGYNRRFYEPVIRLRKRIGEGGLKAADVVISENTDAHISKHGHEVVPHLLAFASAHTLDLMLHLFGSLEPVAMAPHAEQGEAAPFKSHNGILRTMAGVPVSLALNANDPSAAGIRCRFDDGMTWHLAPLEVLTIYDGTVVEPATEEFNIRRYTPRVAERQIVETKTKPGFMGQMSAFLSGNYGPGATVEDARRVLQLIEDIEAAGANWSYTERDMRRVATAS